MRRRKNPNAESLINPANKSKAQSKNIVNKAGAQNRKVTKQATEKKKKRLLSKKVKITDNTLQITREGHDYLYRSKTVSTYRRNSSLLLFGMHTSFIR